MNYRDNIDNNYNLKNLTKCKELIKLNKLEFINKGIQGEVFKVHSKYCGSVVIKKKLLREQDLKYKNAKTWLKKQLKEEYLIMKITNTLINKFICPNFIKVYDFDDNIGLIIMEYANGDSKFLFANGKLFSTEIYKSFLFQVMISIYYYNNALKLTHKDSRLQNILYKKINPNTIFHYKINNIDYYVPTYGYLFMLADFGAVHPLEFNDVEIFNFSIFVNYVNALYPLYKEKMKLTYQEEEIFDLVIEKKEFFDNNLFKQYKQTMIQKLSKVNEIMNNYIFEIDTILTSDKNILEIFKTYFLEYSVNVYDKKNIINFSN
jgi:serine/threonine protein kinase